MTPVSAAIGAAPAVSGATSVDSDPAPAVVRASPIIWDCRSSARPPAISRRSPPQPPAERCSGTAGLLTRQDRWPIGYNEATITERAWALEAYLTTVARRHEALTVDGQQRRSPWAATGATSQRQEGSA